MTSRSSPIYLIFVFFAIATEFGYGYTIFFREHNIEADNFQTHDVVDGHPDVCYDVTSKHPIPDIEGVGLINGAEAGVLVQETINLPGYEAQAPENLQAIALYQGAENFDCIGHPDAIIRFHDSQDPRQTSVQYVDLGKTNPSLAGRYRFWKPIIPADQDWVPTIVPDYGTGYVLIRSGSRYRRPAYTDDNNNMLVSWRDFDSYLEAWMYLESAAAPREGDNQSRNQGQDQNLVSLRDIANQGLNLESSNRLDLDLDRFPQSNSAPSSFESAVRQTGNSPQIKEEDLGDIQVKQEAEELVKVEDVSQPPFNQRPSANIAPQQENVQVPAPQSENNNLNPDELDIPALQAQQQRNPYARPTTAEVGTQTEPQLPKIRIHPEGTVDNFPEQNEFHVPEARRPAGKVTGRKPVDQVVSLLQKRPGLTQTTIEGYLESVATPNTEIIKTAKKMIANIPYAPGTIEYEMEAARIIAEKEEAQLRALRARVNQPLTDPTLDDDTSRALVEMGNMYLVWDQQEKNIERVLLSRNLDNIEPMDPNLARSLTRAQINSLGPDDALGFYLAVNPGRLAELRAKQALQSRELQMQQAQAQVQAQGQQGQRMEEEDEDDNLFAEPK
ncbi:hypothetical protein TWF788_000048 [Orbilia oligospora]|uniref:Uncharacterized protein n=1 Tax=Orbilia oligospora TaxID=2813651 RepID=A0A6G1MFU2_ORBOL|nr:hypothetical protein TWF788_000048 [Orbilia oligospora]KAF3196472.1 hypothetical protein TWF679_005092 [Orbilia oligospora]KAF3255757.1 hypothetical protein TWF192_002197 [Orbilia oligospora]